MGNKTAVWIIVSILIVLSFFIVKNVGGRVTGNVVNEQDMENLHEVELAIENMYCEACAYGVRAQLEELDGVVEAKIDYKSASGVVRYDADKVSAETIAAASTAYPASVVEDRLL